MRGFSRLITVLVLVLSLGLHWVLLQSAAWAGMLYSNSRHATLSEAWVMTFSGKHPCELCKFVRAGKAAEKKQSVIKLATKLDYSFAVSTVWVFPPTQSPEFPTADITSSARFEAPLAPPPRCA